MPRWGQFGKTLSSLVPRHACRAACTESLVNPSRDYFVVPLTPVIVTELKRKAERCQRSGWSPGRIPGDVHHANLLSLRMARERAVAGCNKTASLGGWLKRVAVRTIRPRHYETLVASLGRYALAAPSSRSFAPLSLIPHCLFRDRGRCMLGLKNPAQAAIEARNWKGPAGA